MVAYSPHCRAAHKQAQETVNQPSRYRSRFTRAALPGNHASAEDRRANWYGKDPMPSAGMFAMFGGSDPEPMKGNVNDGAGVAMGPNPPRSIP